MSWKPWKPHVKQEKFLGIPLGVKEGFYAGSAGAGKSDVLLMYPITYQWYLDPNFKGLFLRRTMPELREEIIPRSKVKLDFGKYGGKYNKSDHVWEFESGALFFFGHCENEDDVHKYDSAQWNYVAFDELTSFTEWQYIYLTFERIRRDKDHPHLPAICRSASNPGNIGHAWVRKRFVTPCKTGMTIITGRGGNKRIFIPATLEDNPHIDPEYSQSLDALPEAERRAKKFGEWDAYEGQVFEEFRNHKFEHEPPNALHVIEPFDIPDWWPRILVIDWGYRAMTWAGWGAISPTKKVYIYREQTWRETKIAEWTPYVKEYLDKENIRTIKVCKSAGQDRGQDHTIQQQIESELGRSVILTTNTPGSRVAGKLLLHEYLRWKQKYVPERELVVYNEEIALWTLRNHGEIAHRNYLKRFEAYIPEDIPRLQIFNTCPALVTAIQSCTYDKTHVEDVAGFDGDDPYDGIRYLIDEADKFFEESVDEFAKVQAREQLVQEFEENKDWNTLYWKARLLEKETTDSFKPVARYRRR